MDYEAASHFFENLMAEWEFDTAGVSEVYKALKEAPFIEPESVIFRTSEESPIALIANYTGREQIGDASTAAPRQKNPSIVQTAEKIFADLSKISGIEFRHASPHPEKPYCFAYASVCTDKTRKDGMLVIINQYDSSKGHI